MNNITISESTLLDKCQEIEDKLKNDSSYMAILKEINSLFEQVTAGFDGDKKTVLELDDVEETRVIEVMKYAYIIGLNDGKNRAN